MRFEKTARKLQKRSKDYNNKKRIWVINRKIEALKLCGGACVCCGEGILNFLTIDHIDNDGAIERKNGIKRAKLTNLIVNDKYDLNKVRSLCYNCNGAYGTYRFCAHQFQNVKFTHCNLCDDELLCSVKNGRPTNFHEFLLKSNIYVCLSCILLKKHNINITYYLRKKIRENLNLRTKILNAYGGACECCDENRYIYLTIDHIIQKSKKYRTDGMGSSLYRYLLKNNFPKDNYRILCYNCNCARGHRGSNGICPHKKQDNNLVSL